MRVVIIGCGAYMKEGYGCPGEWKCHVAAAMKEAKFADYDSVELIGFFECNCPGRAVVNNLKGLKKIQEFDVVHLSNCLCGAKLGCPHGNPDALTDALTEAGFKVVHGCHDFG